MVVFSIQLEPVLDCIEQEKYIAAKSKRNQWAVVLEFHCIGETQIQNLSLQRDVIFRGVRGFRWGSEGLTEVKWAGWEWLDQPGSTARLLYIYRSTILVICMNYMVKCYFEEEEEKDS